MIGLPKKSLRKRIEKKILSDELDRKRKSRYKRMTYFRSTKSKAGYGEDVSGFRK